MAIPNSFGEILSGTGIAEPHARRFLELLSESLGIVDVAGQSTTRARLTPEGGVAVKLINGTGAPSVKGAVLTAGTTDRTVVLHPADDNDPIGVFYESGVAAGSECWVVVSGVAEVLLQDGTSAAAGNWVQASESANGRAVASASAPPVSGIIEQIQQHFKELGHCLETATAGVNVLALVVLHFN